MLLHNQRGVAISWDDGGYFKWEPFGSCEVPDELAELIKATGFPVGAAPAPESAPSKPAPSEPKKK